MHVLVFFFKFWCIRESVFNPFGCALTNIVISMRYWIFNETNEIPNSMNWIVFFIVVIIDRMWILVIIWISSKVFFYSLFVSVIHKLLKSLDARHWNVIFTDRSNWATRKWEKNKNITLFSCSTGNWPGTQYHLDILI